MKTISQRRVKSKQRTEEKEYKTEINLNFLMTEALPYIFNCSSETRISRASSQETHH